MKQKPLTLKEREYWKTRVKEVFDQEIGALKAQNIAKFERIRSKAWSDSIDALGFGEVFSQIFALEFQLLRNNSEEENNRIYEARDRLVHDSYREHFPERITP